MRNKRIGSLLCGPPLSVGTPVSFHRRRGRVRRFGSWYVVIEWQEFYNNYDGPPFWKPYADRFVQTARYHIVTPL